MIGYIIVFALGVAVGTIIAAYRYVKAIDKIIEARMCNG